MPFGKTPAQAPGQVEDGLFRAAFDRKPLLSRIAFDYGIGYGIRNVETPTAGEMKGQKAFAIPLGSYNKAQGSMTGLLLC